MTERRSRIGWPTPPELPTGGPPDRARRQRRIGVSILYVAVILNMLLTCLVFSYVLVLKSARDTETGRIHDQLVHNNCALMDQLPAGGPLDRLRATYHCGPGLPAGRIP